MKTALFLVLLTASATSAQQKPVWVLPDVNNWAFYREILMTPNDK